MPWVDSTAAFAVGVLEEFILLMAVTVLARTTQNGYLWFGLFMAFTVHFIYHLVSCFVVRNYAPGGLTAG